MGVGIAVRRRAHPCTRGAWLTLRRLRHAGLAGATAGFAETRWGPRSNGRHAQLGMRPITPGAPYWCHHICHMPLQPMQRCSIPWTIRPWKEGICDRVMDICCALHNVRVRMTPWQPMVESGSTQVLKFLCHASGHYGSSKRYRATGHHRVRCSPHLGPMGLPRHPMACANAHAGPYGAVSLTRARRIRQCCHRDL